MKTPGRVRVEVIGLGMGRHHPQECPSATEHLLECILNDCPPEASAEHGVEMMRIIDAIYRSAAEGREVRLDG